jgi:hypothetical protein
MVFAVQAAAAQGNAPATIVFHYERQGMPVPVYTITLHEDGTGTYAFKRVAQPAPEGARAAAVQALPEGDGTQPISVSSATTAHLFEAIRGTDHFRARCDSKAKNIADTGTKTLEYTGSDGHAACTYNYTENKPVIAVTDTFLGMEEMLEFGARLDHEHLYDRLGLDSEMQKLVQAIKDKQAIEVSTIAPTLQSIADDPQVIERVRVQAGKLLAMR